MPDTTPHPTPSCASCGKVQEPGGTPLQRCSRCHTAHYCSRSCQKADWKTHKPTCGPGTTGATPSSSEPSFKSSKSAIEAMLGISTKDWLSRVSEAEAFKLLIDSYRMRVEDEYVFRGDVSDDSLYGQGNPAIGFRRYLVKAEKRAGVLPVWWSKQKRDECVAKGNEKDPWSSLHYAVEKHDIQEHYQDNMMPMRLRMLAEEISGENVMAP